MPLKHEHIYLSCPAIFECSSPVGLIPRPSTFISIHREEAPTLLTARHRQLKSSTGVTHVGRSTYPKTAKKMPSRMLRDRDVTPKQHEEDPVSIKFKSVSEIVQA